MSSVSSMNSRGAIGLERMSAGVASFSGRHAPRAPAFRESRRGARRNNSHVRPWVRHDGRARFLRAVEPNKTEGTTSGADAMVALVTDGLETSVRPLAGDGKKSAPQTALSKSADADGEPRLVCFTGGTAFNGVVNELMTLTSRVTHVIPVSDDGGSTAEIVRVLGGPAVGDLRSRCLRLSDESTTEARAVKELLAHRLHATDSKLAKEEWYCIQEGDHELWDGISEPYADIIRSFLVHFHTQILAAKVPIKFDFVNGSVGNFFFAGARMFFRSMEAAILLYSRVSRIPTESLVVPNIVLDDNVRVALGATLEDGTTLRGQNEISHPSADPKRFEKVKVNTKTGGIVRGLVTKGGDIRRQGKALAASSDFWKQVWEAGQIPEVSASEFWGGLQRSQGGFERVRDAVASGDFYSAGQLLKSRVDDLSVRPLAVWDIDKATTGYDSLSSPIKRVFYLSTEDPASVSAVYPKVNPTILRQLGECEGVVYGMGSLYTSIIPSLILEGVGEAIAARAGPKVLILNGGQDRETGDMSAAGVVMAVVNALNRAEDPDPSRRCKFAVCDYITDVVAPVDGGIPLDLEELEALGVKRVIQVDARRQDIHGAEYDVAELIDALKQCVTA